MTEQERGPAGPGGPGDPRDDAFRARLKEAAAQAVSVGHEPLRAELKKAILGGLQPGDLLRLLQGAALEAAADTGKPFTPEEVAATDEGVAAVIAAMSETTPVQPPVAVGPAVEDPEAPAPFHGRIVGAIMCGNARETIARAVLSLEKAGVDAVCILDTGVTDDTIAIARTVLAVPVIVRTYKWANDFAAARNALLDFAAAHADWALMLDSDEWLVTDSGVTALALDLVDDADEKKESVVAIAHASRTYWQPRFFRLPASGAFSGRVHEAYSVATTPRKSPLFAFADKAKTAEAARAKYERDLVALLQVVGEDPTVQRWQYYLAQTYECLGQREPAIAHYRKALEAKGWDEEGAWAAYKAAWMLAAPTRDVTAADREAALDVCVAGLRRHPGFAELSWLAGYLCWGLGRPRHAIAWARMAIACGADGCLEAMARTGFAFPPALYERPWEVLAWAYPQIGATHRGDEAKARVAEMTKLREAAAGATAPVTPTLPPPLRTGRGSLVRESITGGVKVRITQRKVESQLEVWRTRGWEIHEASPDGRRVVMSRMKPIKGTEWAVGYPVLGNIDVRADMASAMSAVSS